MDRDKIVLNARGGRQITAGQVMDCEGMLVSKAAKRLKIEQSSLTYILKRHNIPVELIVVGRGDWVFPTKEYRMKKADFIEAYKGMTTKEIQEHFPAEDITRIRSTMHRLGICEHFAKEKRTSRGKKKTKKEDDGLFVGLGPKLVLTRTVCQKCGTDAGAVEVWPGEEPPKYRRCAKCRQHVEDYSGTGSGRVMDHLDIRHKDGMIKTMDSIEWGYVHTI